MNKKDISIIIVSLIIIILGTFFYFKKMSNPTSAQNAVATQTSTPPSTFAPTAFSGFPAELVPAGASAPQYFDNVGATGAIFLVKKTVLDAEASYETQLKNTDWTISNKMLDKNRTILSISDKKAGETGTIQINSMSTTDSTIIISIKK